MGQRVRHKILKECMDFNHEAALVPELMELRLLISFQQIFSLYLEAIQQ
ncbi:hypothetical protein [Desulfosporosinus acidiphilus]|nr:hypothetical protein [Desulfosporosinus acidiphilus]